MPQTMSLVRLYSPHWTPAVFSSQSVFAATPNKYGTWRAQYATALSLKHFTNTDNTEGRYVSTHGPLARYVKLWVAHAPGMPGTFSPPPPVSDPDMHHGICVTHVPWCMPGSLTCSFLWSRWGGKRSRHSRRIRNPQFYVSGKRPISADITFDVPGVLYMKPVLSWFVIWSTCYQSQLNVNSRTGNVGQYYQNNIPQVWNHSLFYKASIWPAIMKWVAYAC